MINIATIILVVVSIFVTNIVTIPVAIIDIIISHATCTHAFVLLYYWHFNA